MPYTYKLYGLTAGGQLIATREFQAHTYELARAVAEELLNEAAQVELWHQAVRVYAASRPEPDVGA